MSLKRGDRVRYGVHIYYIQPHGSWCYLFEKQGDVGVVERASFAPRRDQVFPLTLDEIARIDGKPPHAADIGARHPLTVDDTDVELVWHFMLQLNGHSG